MKKLLIKILGLLVALIFIATPSYAVTATFQEGVDGYTGSLNIQIVSWAGNTQNTNINYYRDTRSNLFYWDISSIPPGSIITDVTITLTLYASYQNNDLRWGAVLDPDATGIWKEYPGSIQYLYNSLSNYNYKEDDSVNLRWSGSSGTFATVKGSTLGTVSVIADYNNEQIVDINAVALTTIVQNWADGTQANMGVWVEDTGTGNAKGRSKYYGTATSRPKLTVVYTAATCDANCSTCIDQIECEASLFPCYWYSLSCNSEPESILRRMYLME